MSTDGEDRGLWPDGIDRLILEETDSTMAEAGRRIPTLAAPTWIMARRQTAARGRRGRSWSSLDGNLFATFVWRPQCSPGEAARRSFLAANALFEALAIYVDRDALALKWPNDVLLNGGKVAGILLESASNGAFVDWLSIGIGVNLAHAPGHIADAPFPPVSLVGEGGERVAPEEFLGVLATNYATQEAKLDRLGFERIRTEWLEHAARLGEVITARTARETVEGIFHGLDDDGNLILLVGGGTRVIPAAEVHF